MPRIAFLIASAGIVAASAVSTFAGTAAAADGFGWDGTGTSQVRAISKQADVLLADGFGWDSTPARPASATAVGFGGD